MVAPLVTAGAHRMDMAYYRGVLPLLSSSQIGIRQATGHRCTPLRRGEVASLGYAGGRPPTARPSASSEPLRHNTRRREAIPRCDALYQDMRSLLSRLLVLQPV